jgi:hypothetical protein
MAVGLRCAANSVVGTLLLESITKVRFYTETPRHAILRIPQFWVRGASDSVVFGANQPFLRRLGAQFRCVAFEQFRLCQVLY